MRSLSPLGSFEHDARSIRGLSAALAIVVLLDVVDVRAPGLALLAVPFLAAAVGLRRARTPATIALFLWSALYVVIGVNWIVADISGGVGAGWGDMMFGYAGTPLAAILSAVLVVREMHLRAEHRGHSMA